MNDRLLIVTPEELARITSLLERGCAIFSAPQVRRLKVIEYAGKFSNSTQAAAARAVGIKPQTINKIIQKLRSAHQVSEEINACEALLVKRTQKKALPAQQPGRPGRTVWEDVEHKVTITDQTIIELASIVVSETACITVLAVHAPKCVHDLIDDFSSSGWEDAVWSGVSGFDWLVAKTMNFLVEGTLSIQAGTDDKLASVSPVSGRFGPQCKFYVIENDELDDSKNVRRKLFPGDSGFEIVSLPPTRNFFYHIDQLLCRLRERYSCIGFMPGLRNLYYAARQWNDNGFESSFHWHTDQHQPTNWRAKRTAARLYLAQSGSLHELSPSLWSRISYARETKFRTLKLRPKVTVAGHDPGKGSVTLFVEPLPECGYSVRINSRDGAQDVAKRHRETLKSDSPRSRFVYSAWANNRHLITPPCLVDKALVATDETEFSATGLVLIPRHFLLPAPEVELDRLATWAMSSQSVLYSVAAQEAGIESDLHIMLMPDVMRGIDEAFSSNRYGDAHHEFSGHQERLRWAQSETKDEVDPDRRVNLLGVDPYSGPYYCFSASDVANSKPSALLSARLEHTDFALDGKRAVGDLAVSNLFSLGGLPVYDCDLAFRNLLIDFDADFLLLGISEEISRRIEVSIKRWGDHIQGVILKRIQGSSGLNAGELWKVARLNRETVDDKIIDCFTSTLPVFCERYAYSARRRAVENAQRLALKDYEPAAVVVESENAIYRTWCSYFGKRARGLFAAVAASHHKEQQQLCEMVGSSQTRGTNSRQITYDQFSEDIDVWDEGQDSFDEHT